MSHPIITFIGAGNMGSSLISGLINGGHPADKLWAADLSEEKLVHLRDRFQIHTTTDNHQAAQVADVIIFAVKPQIFTSIATPLATDIKPQRTLVISIMAGVREASIQHCLGGNVPIVRTMPNTPALISCGATALFANPYVNAAQHSLAESIMRAVGITVWLQDEKQMDAVTALSGSGPAYFFHFMECLEQVGQELGLPADIAHLLTLQTALGAAKMAIESAAPLAELRRNVTSPGGTTEKALSVFEEKQLRVLVKQALVAAKLRSEELSGEKH
jgi:pyrroline-5-carboxylate reductase